MNYYNAPIFIDRNSSAVPYGMPARTGSTMQATTPQVVMTAARPAGLPPVFEPSISTALLGAVIGGANALGRNLYRVRKDEISMSQAITRAVLDGAATSAATTAAGFLTAGLTENNALRLAALAASTAGLSYLIAAGFQSILKR